MTTRKQKHEEALARRQQFLENERKRNAEVLRASREREELKRRESQRPKHDKQHSWKKVDKDCLHCQDLLRAQEAQRRQLESAGANA